MGFNFGKTISDIMKDDTFRGITKSVGGMAGNLINKSQNMLGGTFDMFSNISKGVGNIFGSSMFPFILVGCLCLGAFVFISVRSPATMAVSSIPNISNMRFK